MDVGSLSGPRAENLDGDLGADARGDRELAGATCQEPGDMEVSACVVDAVMLDS